MIANKVYFCTFCERSWTQLPEGAEKLTTKRGGRQHVHTYRFVDGSVHFIIRKAA
jgi:hypothetical protein